MIWNVFARQLIAEKIKSASDKIQLVLEPRNGTTTTGLGEIYQYTLEVKPEFKSIIPLLI
jgi:cobalt-zinc-cadmium resistance protein CzcA